MKKRAKRPKRSDNGTPQFIVNPEWEDSETAREKVRAALEFRAFIGGEDEFIDYFPQDYDRAIPVEGAWIRVNDPPTTEYTVPPFSMWYAKNWQYDRCEIAGIHPKRVKIQTPAGDLGLFPHEYVVIEKIKEYVGRESEGVFFRTLGGDPPFPTDQLFYILSRGVPRQEACMMLLDQMHDMSFGWFEIAPHYGEAFGRDWPEPERCPFATLRSKWIADEEKEAA